MDQWIVSGVFLLGAGTGSLASALLHAGQIRIIKALLESAPPLNSKTEESSDNRTCATPQNNSLTRILEE